MDLEKQILEILEEHLRSSYDNGTINDGGITGGEEAAREIIKKLNLNSEKTWKKTPKN